MANQQGQSELNNGKKAFQGASEELKKGVSGATQDIKHGAQEIGRAVKSASNDVMRQLGDSGSAAFQRVSETAKDATAFLDEEVRKSPLMALGVAFGLGLVMAGFLRRS